MLIKTLRKDRGARKEKGVRARAPELRWRERLQREWTYMDGRERDMCAEVRRLKKALGETREAWRREKARGKSQRVE